MIYVMELSCRGLPAIRAGTGADSVYTSIGGGGVGVGVVRIAIGGGELAISGGGDVVGMGV